MYSYLSKHEEKPHSQRFSKLIIPVKTIQNLNIYKLYIYSKTYSGKLFKFTTPVKTLQRIFTTLPGS
jgi:hypothetical protein